MSVCAPVAFFTYNRPIHTKKALEALRANKLAENTDLYIFSDGAKGEADRGKVREVRSVIGNVDGFRSVTITTQEKNVGLASSLIQGVTTTVENFGKLIVLEDDLITSPAFLSYMNRALDYYEETPEVWHISGWSFPSASSTKAESFFWRHMTCWGWGTWADRWRHYEKDVDKLLKSFSSQQIRRFNLDGNEKLWSQVTDNKFGKVDTWAIFWYATIFQKCGLCLNPTSSFVWNIGADGSGTNVGPALHEKNTHEYELNANAQVVFPDVIKESKWALDCYIQYQKMIRGSRTSRTAKKVKRYITRLIKP